MTDEARDDEIVLRIALALPKRGFRASDIVDYDGPAGVLPWVHQAGSVRNRLGAAVARLCVAGEMKRTPAATVSFVESGSELPVVSGYEVTDKGRERIEKADEDASRPPAPVEGNGA